MFVRVPGVAMGQWGRWAAVGAVSMAAFAVCVGAAVAVVPWDRADRVAVGSGAGAVLAAVVLAWSSSRVGTSAGEAGAGQAVGPEGRAAEGSSAPQAGRAGEPPDARPGSTGPARVRLGDVSGTVVIGDHNVVGDQNQVQ